MPFAGTKPKRKKKSSYQARDAKRNKNKRKSTELSRKIKDARSSHKRIDLDFNEQIALEVEQQMERETELEAEREALLLSSRSERASIMGATYMDAEFSEDEDSDEESMGDLDPADDSFCEYAVASSVENKRMAIAYFFEKTFNCPPEEEWGGKDGIITKICGFFDQNTESFRKTVKRVFSMVLKCQTENIVYKGQGDYDGNCGSKPLIEDTSIWAQIIADSIESGNSISVTTFIVNQHRCDNLMPSFTTSAVYGCYRRMKPKLKSVERAKQGNPCSKSPWARARARWMAQLLLIFSEIDYTDKLFDQFKRDAEGKIPACFDVTFLQKMSKFKTAWWDETHKKCHIGASGSRIGPGKDNVTVHFPRDAEGNVDLVNGKYTEAKSVLSVKYEKEVRFCLGVFLKEGDSGEVTGEKLKMFNYTEKTIVAIERRDKLRSLAILHVKKAKRTGTGTTSVWIKNTREDGAIYRNDSTGMIKGIGPGKVKALAELDIHSVNDLKNLATEKIENIGGKTISGLTTNSLNKWHHLAQVALDEDAPTPVDHRDAVNPFMSRFPLTWEFEIDKIAMAGKICVTELIDHIFTESRKAIGPDYMVYHDALSLMTGKTAVQYMRDKGYYSHWILPQLGLMEAGGDDLNSYRNRPVGNSPEVMPLDCSLNEQVHRAVRSHVELTQIYKGKTEYEGLQFSMAAPIAGVSAYERVWSIYPLSSNIRKDIEKVFVSAKTILKEKGCVVPHLGSRVGKRHVATGTTSSGWGGARTRIRKEDERGSILVHEDAEPALGLRVILSQKKYDIKLEKEKSL